MNCKVGDHIQLSLERRNSSFVLKGETTNIHLFTTTKKNIGTCSGLVVDMHVKFQLAPTLSGTSKTHKIVKMEMQNVTHILLLISSPQEHVGKIVQTTSNSMTTNGVQVKILD